MAFVRMVHKNAKWDKRRSYRMIGNPFPEQRLVSFQIQEALPIENGRVLDGTVSPTFALCRAEGSPSQIPPRKKKPTVGQREGRVAKQRKIPALKNRISEIKEAHLVTIRLA